MVSSRTIRHVPGLGHQYVPEPVTVIAPAAHMLGHSGCHAAGIEQIPLAAWLATGDRWPTT